MRKQDLNKLLGEALKERDAARGLCEELADALDEHKQQLQGNLLALWLLAKKAGGEIRISQANFDNSPISKLGVGFDEETKEWVFIAHDPQPEPQKGDVNDQADGSAGDASAASDGVPAAPEAQS